MWPCSLPQSTEADNTDKRWSFQFLTVWVACISSHIVCEVIRFINRTQNKLKYRADFPYHGTICFGNISPFIQWKSSLCGGHSCLTLFFQEDLNKETLLKQFKIVKAHTNTSHVQQFGNKVTTTPSLVLIIWVTTWLNFYFHLMLIQYSVMLSQYYA